MNVRYFDGVDDVIELSATAAMAAIGGGAFTIASIFKPFDFATGAPFWLGVDGTGTHRVSLQTSPANGGQFLLHVDGNFRTGHQNQSGKGWLIQGFAKAAGSAIPRAHNYNFGSKVWAHFDTSSAVPDAANTGSELLIGRFQETGSNFMEGHIAVVAAWDRVLDDTEFETLDNSLQAWVDSVPVGLWALNQADVTDGVLDSVGDADEVARTGTAVVTNDDPFTIDTTYAALRPAVVAP